METEIGGARKKEMKSSISPFCCKRIYYLSLRFFNFYFILFSSPFDLFLFSPGFSFFLSFSLFSLNWGRGCLQQVVALMHFSVIMVAPFTFVAHNGFELLNGTNSSNTTSFITNDSAMRSELESIIGAGFTAVAFSFYANLFLFLLHAVPSGCFVAAIIFWLAGNRVKDRERVRRRRERRRKESTSDFPPLNSLFLNLFFFLSSFLCLFPSLFLLSSRFSCHAYGSRLVACVLR
jgi:hypothetical protein